MEGGLTLNPHREEMPVLFPGVALPPTGALLTVSRELGRTHHQTGLTGCGNVRKLGHTWQGLCSCALFQGGRHCSVQQK